MNIRPERIIKEDDPIRSIVDYIYSHYPEITKQHLLQLVVSVRVIDANNRASKDRPNLFQRLRDFLFGPRKPLPNLSDIKMPANYSNAYMNLAAKSSSAPGIAIGQFNPNPKE